MKQKAFIFLIVGILVFAGSVGGAFAGGIAVGKKQSPATTFQNIRGQFPNGFTGSTNIPGGTNGVIGRGTMGTVDKIEGNKITVRTIQGTTVTVVTDTSTTYQKTDSGAFSDVVVGKTVSVSGTTQTDGTVKASRVSVSPDIPIQTPAQ